MCGLGVGGSTSALWIGADKCSVERAAVSAVESMSPEPMGEATGENSSKYLSIH